MIALKLAVLGDNIGAIRSFVRQNADFPHPGISQFCLSPQCAGHAELSLFWRPRVSITESKSLSAGHPVAGRTDHLDIFSDAGTIAAGPAGTGLRPAGLPAGGRHGDGRRGAGLPASVYFRRSQPGLERHLLIPILLQRLIHKLGLHRVMDTIDHPARVMMGGASLVVFSYYVSLPVVAHSPLVTLNAIAVSLAVVLLGMLLMITRRQAVAHVVGFMSIENGLFFAAVVSTYGMPMVVELGVAFDVLVAAVVFGVFFFQINASIDSLNVDQLSKLSEVDK